MMRSRMLLVPLLFKYAMRTRPVSGSFFRFVSQTGIGYRKSPAVAGATAKGPARPGDRAPYGVFGDGSGLYDLLRGTGHHLLLFEGRRRDPARLEAAGDVVEGLLDRYEAPVTVHRIPAEERGLHERYGARTSTVFLIRPDGHVAYRGEATDAVGLKVHLDRLFVGRGVRERTHALRRRERMAR